MSHLGEMDKCFEKGLLKRTAKSKNLALQDIGQAEFFLNEAFDLIEMAKREMAGIALYACVFHAGRALLFLDGIKEKSHYCLQKYLEEKFLKTGILGEDDLSLFDLLRGMRQEIQYDVIRTKFEEDLGALYSKAERFVENVKKIVMQEDGDKMQKPQENGVPQSPPAKENPGQD